MNNLKLKLNQLEKEDLGKYIKLNEQLVIFAIGIRKISNGKERNKK
jgi:hypothetical protein